MKVQDIAKMTVEDIPKSITESYIRNNFDIESEKIDVEHVTELSSLDISFNEEMSLDSYIAQIKESYNKITDGDEDEFLKTNYYGYDGAFEIVVCRRTYTKEDDLQTIFRIGDLLRNRRKEALKEAKLKDLESMSKEELIEKLMKG
jgi:hypothetical protein